jgi:hypothetical protein
VLYPACRADHGAEEPKPLVPHGDLVHCYRLSELAAGRSTVVAVPWLPAREGGELYLKPCGPSLLTVLGEYLAALHRLDEWEIMQPWNEGAGSIGREDVEASRMALKGIEALQRRLADSPKPTEK